VLGTISDSSYWSTAPKPVHSGQEPYGLLKEKSCGEGRANSISGWSGQRKRSVKRKADPSSRITAASPSPSASACCSESASRSVSVRSTRRRSTTTSSSLALVRSVEGSPARSSRWRSRPSARTRRKPRARRFSTTRPCVTRAESGSGKATVKRVPSGRARVASVALCTLSGRTSLPQGRSGCAPGQ
jgi:hypothetical protein